MYLCLIELYVSLLQFFCRKNVYFNLKILQFPVMIRLLLNFTTFCLDHIFITVIAIQLFKQHTYLQGLRILGNKKSKILLDLLFFMR